MFSNRKLRKRINKDGVLIETNYVLYLNNQDAIQFNSRDDLQKYLKDYRANNDVFKLQIFKVETYSL